MEKCEYTFDDYHDGVVEFTTGCGHRTTADQTNWWGVFPSVEAALDAADGRGSFSMPPYPHCPWCTKGISVPKHTEG